MIDSEFYNNNKNIVLYKPNPIVDAGFDLSLPEFNLISLAINKLFRYYKNHQNFGDGKVLITANEFAYATKCSLTHAYATLKDATTSLIGKQLKFTVYMSNEGRQPGEMGNITVTKPKHNNFVMFREPCYWVKEIECSNNNGVMLLNFSDNVKFLISKTEKSYTKYQLSHALALKTFHSRKLYELLVKWEKVGTVEMPVYEWKEYFGVEASYQEISEFIRRVLSPTIKNINTKTAFDVTLTSIKVSRIITHFRIQIKRKTTQKSGATQTSAKNHPIDKNLGDSLKKISKSLPYKKSSNELSSPTPTTIAEDTQANQEKLIKEMLANPKFVAKYKQIDESEKEFLSRIEALQYSPASVFFEYYQFHLLNKA